MKTHGRLHFILIVFYLFALQSCIDSAGNRRSIKSTGGLSSIESGIQIQNACVCNNGSVIDGGPSCSIACTTTQGDKRNIALLDLTLGRDIIQKTSIILSNTFSTSMPLKSICDGQIYKCQLAVKEISYDDQGQLKEVERNLTVSSQTGSILSDSSSKSVVKMIGLSKPKTEIGFKILFENEEVFLSEKSAFLNLYKGDGILDPKAVLPFNSYTCLMAHKIADNKFKTSLETYHYTTKIPQYFYQNPAPGSPPSTWAFLCHNNPSFNTMWDFSNNFPSLGTDVEVPGPQPFPRLNAIYSGITLWGQDDLDFSPFIDTEHGLNFDIERRIFEDYIKNPKNHEVDWEKNSIFSLFIENLKPEETIYIGADQRPIIKPVPAKMGYFMQPQPIDSFQTLRKSFKCPTRSNLEASDEGRLASIKKILSSSSGLLKYTTKPFFAACANGITLTSQQNGLPATFSNRRIIYVTYDDLKKMNPNWTDEDIFSSTYQSSITFTLKQYYDSKGVSFNDKKTMVDMGDNLRFTLVRRSVSQNNSQNCSDPDPADTIGDGFIYGCYPVLIP